MAAPHPPLVVLEDVSKEFPNPAGSHRALDSIRLEIDPGESVAITGRSGSGKSTLLHLIGGIDRPTRGEVRVAGTAVHAASERALARWRGRSVGIVFQFFQLLPTLTAAENVMLPMDLRDVRPPRERRRRALELLDWVGVADQADKLPSALSGGQQQRAAVARALANDPPLLLADEPTGNLDSTTARGVLELFRRLKERGTTLVIATHERDLAGLIDRTVELADGRIVGR
jgi:putative ABC transport system ATP-binding protein